MSVAADLTKRPIRFNVGDTDNMGMIVVGITPMIHVRSCRFYKKIDKFQCG